MSKAIVVALAMLASASALQAPKTLRASANGPRFTTAVPAETDVAVAVEKPEAEAAVVVGEAPTAAAWRAACDADGVMSYADFGVKLAAGVEARRRRWRPSAAGARSPRAPASRRARRRGGGVRARAPARRPRLQRFADQEYSQLRALGRASVLAPKILDGSHAGDYGFDPAGFCTTNEELYNQMEAEKDMEALEGEWPWGVAGDEDFDPRPLRPLGKDAAGRLHARSSAEPRPLPCSPSSYVAIEATFHIPVVQLALPLRF
ncbi:hypothetical protein JL720_15725 [Aureococcus anophagefferens]|nr:hypothetical protein JL720_15725 [Aureococcus anophagefferens]